MSSDKKKQDEPSQGRKFGTAVLFGLAFGFLLQKSGVAKYNVLIGVLLFEDFTVVKVMVSAILVAMPGLFILRRIGKVELKIKPTRIGANIGGGLVFGAGFALTGYCPGTGAAAVGQMSWDALFVVVGMVAGSYLYAEVSAWVGRTIQRWGDRGKLLLPEAVGMPRPAFIVAMMAVLGAGLYLLERFA